MNIDTLDVLRHLEQNEFFAQPGLVGGHCIGSRPLLFNFQS